MEQPQKPMLEVPDAEDRETFIANARGVWNQRHPDKQKTPGKHGDSRIIVVLGEVLRTLPRRAIPAINRLKVLTAEKFANPTYIAQRFPDDPSVPSTDTIYKYARLTNIFMKWMREDNRNKIIDVEYFSEKLPASDKDAKGIIDIVMAVEPNIRKVMETLESISSKVTDFGIEMSPNRAKSLQKVILAFQDSTKRPH